MDIPADESVTENSLLQQLRSVIAGRQSDGLQTPDKAYRLKDQLGDSVHAARRVLRQLARLTVEWAPGQSLRFDRRTDIPEGYRRVEWAVGQVILRSGRSWFGHPRFDRERMDYVYPDPKEVTAEIESVTAELETAISERDTDFAFQAKRAKDYAMTYAEVLDEWRQSALAKGEDTSGIPYSVQNWDQNKELIKPTPYLSGPRWRSRPANVPEDLQRALFAVLAQREDDIPLLE